MAVQRSVSSSPVGSPASIPPMLEFATQHDVTPVTDKFGFHQVNESVKHLESGKAHYRILLNG